MYIALSIMCAGIVVGRLFRSRISMLYVDRCLLASIMLLLFLLGVSLGSDRALLANLPTLGKNAAILTVCYLVGSILAQVVLKKTGLFKNIKK